MAEFFCNTGDCESKSKFHQITQNLACVFGFIAVIGVIILVVPGFYEDRDLFNGFCISVVIVSVLGILFFFVGRKNIATIVSVFLSVITLFFIGLYVYYIIPYSIEKTEKEYLQLLNNADRANRSTYNISAYPYSNLKEFFKKEKQSYYKVQDYLLDLFDDRQYEKWISISNFVQESLYTLPVYDKEFMNSLWEASYDVELTELQYYDILFDNKKVKEYWVIKKLRDAINEEVEWEEYRKTHWGYKLVMEDDWTGCRLYNRLLIYRVRNDSSLREYYILVMNLDTGTYFLYEYGDTIY